MPAGSEKYQAKHGDDNNENQSSDSSKKAAKVAAKGAADYFTGGKGGAIVDKLADTKLGNQILDKAGQAIDKNPQLKKMAEQLDKKGALDTADKGLSMMESGGAAGEGGSLGGSELGSKGSKSFGLNREEVNTAKAEAYSSSQESDSSTSEGDVSAVASGFEMPKLFNTPKSKVIAGAVGAVILFIFGFFMIMAGSDEDGNDPGEINGNNQDASTSGTTCNYTIKGFTDGTHNYNVKIDSSDIKVRLLECGGFTPVSGEELIDFEKYITGVVYQENGNGSNEAIKTQAVAARSYALSRPSLMGNAFGLKLSEESGKWVLQIRACTYDQAYCDPDKGCWSNGTGGEYGNTIHSGQDSSKTWSRGPLDQNSKIRTLVADTAGEVVVNKDGYILSTGYKNTDQQKWNSYTNLDYKQILLQHYSAARDIVKMECKTTNFASTGEFAGWKQANPNWSSITLGSTSSTLGRVGCLVTSVSMLIAKSGVETTISPFNPGTFVQALNTNGGFTGADFIWSKANVVAPKFVFQNKINILSLSKEEKLSKIKDLVNSGYYVVAEVKGSTGQHWVAIDSVDGNNVNIMDPGTKDGTISDLWSSYPWQNTSQLGYYKVS